MARDENGIDASATDGEPGGKAESDQVAMRRARKEAAAAASDQEAIDAMNGGKRGRPIDGQDDAESEEEMFPAGSIPGDHAVTMKNIVPAGKGRKTEAKMNSAAIPLRDGLVRYGELVELLVTVEAGKVEEVPDLEEQDTGGRRKLLGVKDVQRFRPVHVASAAGVLTVGQVVDILEERFGIPRTADKVAEVFGPQTPEQHAAAASG